MKSALRILVVDDHEQVRDLVIDILNGEGISTIGAKDGLDALSLLQNNRTFVDGVITDMQMPVMCGLELISRLQELKPKTASGARTRIIGMSGNWTPELRLIAFSRGVDSILEKPFTNEDLRKALALISGFNQQQAIGVF